MDVWAVTYREKPDDEPIITIFDNYEAALKMYEKYEENIPAFLMSFDKCKVYSMFLTEGE